MFRLVAALTAAVAAVSAQGQYGTCEAGTCMGRAANPSVYNFEIGGGAAKVISDGALMFPAANAFLEDPEMVRTALENNFQSTEDPISLELNVLYVEWGADKILFDTGIGFVNNETAGWLFNQLDVDKISRDSITKIFISHGHFDHIAGLIESPEASHPAFPNADIYISQEDLDFFTSPNPTFENDVLDDATKANLFDTFNLVYSKVKDKVKTFPAGQGDIVSGISSFLCPYHTPGSVAFTLTPPEGGDPFVYAGDCIGYEPVTVNNQFKFLFDTFLEDGPAGRATVLERLAAESVKTLLYHDSFPALGYIVPDGESWRVQRVNWEHFEGVQAMCPL